MEDEVGGILLVFWAFEEVDVVYGGTDGEVEAVYTVVDA